MAEVVADVKILLYEVIGCLSFASKCLCLCVFVHVCVMRAVVGIDEINCPTVEAR